MTPPEASSSKPAGRLAVRERVSRACGAAGGVLGVCAGVAWAPPPVDLWDVFATSLFLSFAFASGAVAAVVLSGWLLSAVTGERAR